MTQGNYSGCVILGEETNSQCVKNANGSWTSHNVRIRHWKCDTLPTYRDEVLSDIDTGAPCTPSAEGGSLRAAAMKTATKTAKKNPKKPAPRKVAKSASKTGLRKVAKKAIKKAVKKKAKKESRR